LDDFFGTFDGPVKVVVTGYKMRMYKLSEKKTVGEDYLLDIFLFKRVR
jgi:hypothetical protein